MSLQEKQMHDREAVRDKYAQKREEMNQKYGRN